jgi:hypothetical protein
MDQRYGAWAQLLVLFRLIHDGAEAGAMRLPKRHGVLFDPDRFPFLEGRAGGSARQIHERVTPPLVPDGTIWRALEKLLVLDGERISYRALDVEQIGSVYETMMGFRLETAAGRSVAVKAQKKYGAPTALDLEALLASPAKERAKVLQDRTDRKLTDTVKKAVAEAATLEDLHAALLPVIDQAATPDLVPRGAMVLQPSEERRRSGSHYTPRALTEPIIPRRDLPPGRRRPGRGLARLGRAARDPGRRGRGYPCAPARGAALPLRRGPEPRGRGPRQGLALARHARQGPPFTFLDHALRHGDSLVGLTRRQIEAFHWEGAALPGRLRGDARARVRIPVIVNVRIAPS